VNNKLVLDLANQWIGLKHQFLSPNTENI